MIASQKKSMYFFKR